MSTRKLLTEIERTLKKVTEGIEEFEEFEEKLNSATTPSQKERWEGEMKKEIKKLQRLRDQIKTWQTSAEIKDKTLLNESRKNIEALMEKFKILEKDMKIKAYSKEGLIAASKLDPKEKEKLDLINWICSTVDKLKTQVDLYEAELEANYGGKRTTFKKSSLPPRQSRLENHLVHHQIHIDKLELILRLIENDELQIEDVIQIKDTLDDYLERNDEQDYMNDDTIYDDLSLDDIESTPIIPVAKPLETLSEATNEKQIEGSLSSSRQFLSDTSGGGKPSSVKTHSLSLSTSTMPKISHNSTQKIPGSETLNAWTQQPKIDKKLQSSTPSNVTKDQSNASISVIMEQSQQLENTELSQNHFTPFSISISHSFSDLEQELKSKMDGYENSRIIQSRMQSVPDTVLEQKHAEGISREGIDGHRLPPPFSVVIPRLPLLNKPALYEKLDLDTLFTIFYYQPGTFSQYLAARELKKQSWRFHKKYLTWFQRHEEPRVITEDYEQGTYIYFDYEGAWCQRKKSEFTFEYRFLEDAELV